jgi:hypothetical protein
MLENRVLGRILKREEAAKGREAAEDRIMRRFIT